MRECAVGERVTIRDKDGDCHAFVRYVGPIDGKAGVWVGVEWDDSARGRHDGSVAGRRYFTCVKAGQGASFIRQEKVHGGVGLHEAVRARYAPDGEARGAGGGMSIDTVGHRHLRVSLQGADRLAARLSQLELLQSITLHRQQIARPVRIAHLAGQSSTRTAPWPSGR